METRTCVPSTNKMGPQDTGALLRGGEQRERMRAAGKTWMSAVTSRRSRRASMRRSLLVEIQRARRPPVRQCSSMHAAICRPLPTPAEYVFCILGEIIKTMFIYVILYHKYILRYTAAQPTHADLVSGCRQ